MQLVFDYITQATDYLMFKSAHFNRSKDKTTAKPLKKILVKCLSFLFH